MRVLPYYIIHTVINSIKKLFKTWVAVFLVIILAFGLIGGVIGFTVGSFVEDETANEEIIYDEEYSDEDVPLTPEEKQEMLSFIKGCVFLITLTVILFSIYGGDKSGAKIFTMPDVNFLFASPMAPQSVLMFRTVLQMGIAIASSIYILFQIPNLVMNVGLSLMTCIGIFIAYAFLLYFSRLASVFTYTVTATNYKLKKFVRPIVILIFACLIGIYALILYKENYHFIYAFLKMFSDWINYVPIFGWLASFVIALSESLWIEATIYLLLLIFGSVILTALIWKIKADFYEDAFSGAQETQQAALVAAGEKVQRKKERSEKIARNSEFKSLGAAVFFEKTLYNRKRFAKFGILTNTAITYIIISLALTFALSEIFSFSSDVPLGFVLFAFVFFRNLGNPLGEEMNCSWLYMVPESPAKKLWFAVLGSVYESALDLLPALIIAFAALPEKLIQLIIWYVVWITLDLFCSAVGLFVELSLPSALVPAIKAMLAIYIRMFAVVPVIILLIIGAATGNLYLLSASVLLNLIPAVIFMCLSPIFLHNGKK